MENSGLSLDRITGLPVIPGSAVKGITRHQALWEIRRANDREQQIHLLRVTLAVFGFTPNDLGDRGDFCGPRVATARLLMQPSSTWGQKQARAPARF